MDISTQLKNFGKVLQLMQILLLSFSPPACASNANKMEISEGNNFQELPLELKTQIVHDLPFQDALSLRESCHDLMHPVRLKLSDDLRPLYDNRMIYSKEDTAQARKLVRCNPNLMLRMLEELKAPILHNAREFFDKNGYLTKLGHDPLAADYYKGLVTTKLAQVKQLFQLLGGVPVNNCLEYLLDVRNYQENLNIYQQATLQHLLSQTQFYVSFDISSVQKNSLVNSAFGKDVLNQIRDLKKQRGYLSYESIAAQNENILGILAVKTQHILITASDLLNIDCKRNLELMVNQNPEHTLVLIVDEQIAPNGKFMLRSEHLPEGLKHLVITDPRQIATSIENGFLKYSKTLQSLDCSGLTAVITIKANFLYYVPSILSVVLTGLTSLEFVDEYFMWGSENLVAINFGDLIAVRTLKNHGFLHKSSARVDMMGVESLPEENPLRTACHSIKVFNKNNI